MADTKGLHRDFKGDSVLAHKLGELITNYRAAKAVFVAAELNLFHQLDCTDGRLESLAKRSKVKVRYLGIILDVLAALKFIEKRRGKYRNTMFSREYLHPDGIRSVANNLRYQEFLGSSYADLLQTVRSGRPRRSLRHFLSRRPGFVSSYINGMAEIARGPSADLAQVLDLSKTSAMLDVGGGPGLFSLACLKRSPSLQAVILDLPETLRYTKKFVQRSNFADRVDLRPGDYHKADFGSECFDLILMSHITHDESPDDNAALIRKAYLALKKGGRLVIHDFMTYDGRTAPLFSVLFSMHMAAYTETGQAYEEKEYLAWLKGAGFSSIRQTTISPKAPNPTIALIASKN